MNFIRFFKDVSKDDTELVGGKGASLGELTRAGIPVPPGFVITAEAYDRFLSEAHLHEDIYATLACVDSESTDSVTTASEKIRDAMHDSGMPADIEKEIMAAWKKLGSQLVAVRSSATAEDSSIASWAGELETYLNTSKKDLLNHIVQCWSSLFTPRAIFYRFEKQLGDVAVRVGVVVQAMVQSKVSGICFTVHPVTQDRSQMIIEAGWGLGEAIVSGQITPDSYIVDKTDDVLLDMTIAKQARRLERADAGCDWVKVPLQQQEKQKLSGKEIIELAQLCKKIEQHYGSPQDIEWAHDGKQFYITQSRPITTLRSV
ncbi:MAG: PEP/pyruvate-binding domain-containing protein [bacterium]|nr:PEP/pyruvate-binding domain-containing protein [bacterium]